MPRIKAGLSDRNPATQIYPTLAVPRYGWLIFNRHDECLKKILSRLNQKCDLAQDCYKRFGWYTNWLGGVLSIIGGGEIRKTTVLTNIPPPLSMGG